MLELKPDISCDEFSKARSSRFLSLGPCQSSAPVATSSGFGIATTPGESSIGSIPDVILILEIFDKKTTTTPNAVIEDCRRRMRHYDEHVR